MGLNRNTAPHWVQEAHRREQIADRALRGLDPRWPKLSTKAMRLFYIENIERCYAKDPVAFSHFEPLILALITAKLES